ncbi:MerR family transcriptional regulator [Pseudomonas sp. S9]|uniref:MerR family transcriptional regulator n=1 Tax=Pseudomonas sp. S9 TaxID=686578 RepID=UPI0002F9FC67|nr:MerR family transcriptional regulator [Pseudomonas sp. S9]
MRIGQLAKRTGVSHRALRHYEAQALIESTRQENGYREYGHATVEGVLWVRELIDCGFSTRQIHGLLAYLEDSEPGSEHFRQCLQQHMEKLGALDSLIAQLSERRQRLFERLRVYTDPDAPTHTDEQANDGLDLEYQGINGVSDGQVEQQSSSDYRRR